VLGGQPHLLGYNPGNGTVRMLRIGMANPDSPTLTELWRDEWKPTWLFMPFVLGGTQHYLAYRQESGRVHLTRLGADGHGHQVFAGDWSTGWTHFHPFEVGGHPHFLAYKSGTGKVHLTRIDDGATGTTTLKEGEWRSGWTNFARLSSNGRRFAMYRGPLHVGSMTFIGSGAIQVRDVDSGARGTTQIWCDDWRGTVSSLIGYMHGGVPHLLRYESNNGEARFYAFESTP
jgi:hypothetical protein